MPAYLCHGFRWHRRSIVVYVVVQNLDDAAPHWIVKHGSARNVIESFYQLFEFLPPCTLPPSSNSWHSRPNSNLDGDDGQISYRATPRSSRSRSRSRSRQLSIASDALGATISGAMVGPSRHGSLTCTSHLSRHSSTQTPPSPLVSHLDAAAGSDPVLAQDWSPVKLLEEFDPANLDEVSGPYAYVADYVTRIDDSCSIVEEFQKYESRVRHASQPPVTGPSSDEMLNKKRDTTKLGDAAGWLEKLRDELQRDEQIRWYVVVNGDEERKWPDEDEVSPRAASSRSSVTPGRSNIAQHEQYLQQQMAFEAQDLEMKREQLRREMGYEQGGVLDRRLERGHKLPPLKGPRTSKSLSTIPFSTTTPLSTVSPSRPLQALRSSTSLRSLSTIRATTEATIPSVKSPKSPKTPVRATFKKLFSRGKVEEDGTPV